VAERLLRIIDQLDETLIENTHIVFMSSKHAIVPYEWFIVPLICIIAGYFVPVFIDFILRPTSIEDYESNKKAIIFFLLTYALGLFFIFTPSFIADRLHLDSL